MLPFWSFYFNLALVYTFLHLFQTLHLLLNLLHLQPCIYFCTFCIFNLAFVFEPFAFSTLHLFSTFRISISPVTIITLFNFFKFLQQFIISQLISSLFRVRCHSHVLFLLDYDSTVDDFSSQYFPQPRQQGFITFYSILKNKNHLNFTTSTSVNK